MKQFHEEYGYLTKCLKTGEIETGVRHPVSESVKDNTELVEGYAWVKVKITYTEVLEK